MKRSTRLGCCAILLAAFGVMPVQANDITTEWSSVKPPPVPELPSAMPSGFGVSPTSV
jgi:hypothetical protein